MDDHKFVINENISNYFGKDKCKEVIELCSQYDLDLFDLIDVFFQILLIGVIRPVLMREIL